jgi:adenylosuccinate lyase
MTEKSGYESPFSTRYASDEMQYLFSADCKFKTWRKLWIALAEAEQKAGLDITDEQIAEMKAHADDIDYAAADAYEAKLRHDVMAHVSAWGDRCPNAKPIIHLGATSCFVGDNTDIIIMRDALGLVRGKLLSVMRNLRDFAMLYKDMPALAYTHLQPAQLTTVGKRATLWLYELSLDFADLDYVRGSLKLLGSKGTTGTQASFMELFGGDGAKCRFVEDYIAEKFGFEGCVPVSGQTYSRKFDTRVVNMLAGIASSAYKFANDLRILQSFKEMEEPFEKNQIGSSAMPYKRNPMRSERICALARYVLCDALNPAITASTQWFERTLDDSANKRISVAEAFLAVDAILNIYINVTSGLVVYPKVIRSRVMAELPFMATENIMMDAVKRGGDRQELHERIRVHSIAAGKRVKEDGEPNDLIERICADPAFGVTREEIEAHLAPENYTGRSAEQVVEFVEQIDRLLAENAGDAAAGAELRV